MSQETLNGLLTYLLGTLSYDNRKWLAKHLLEPKVQDDVIPYTMEEINARLEESEKQIAQGLIYSNDEVLAGLKRVVP